MKIKFKTGISGPNYSYSKGDEADFDKKKAIRLCEAGIARPIKEEDIEKQVKNKSENEMVTFDDLKKKKGGHYYLDGEHFAHGEENAKEKIKELNEG